MGCGGGRVTTLKGALTVLDPTGKITEVNQAFNCTLNAGELAKLTYTIAHGGPEYQIPFGPIPQTVAFYIKPSSPLELKYNANTNIPHLVSGPVIEFSTISALFVTPDPILDITLDVILLGP